MSLSSHHHIASHHITPQHNHNPTRYMHPPPKKGREPHVDFSCSSVWSAQLRGRKLWRFLPPDSGAVRRHLSTTRTQTRWPLPGAVGLEVVLEPGDIVAWGPGWTHGTSSKSAESVALSVEFADPTPTTYLETHGTLLRAHSQEFQSWSHCGWF